MILAAGRGDRMRPLTDTTPKPMLVAGGKPLIIWTIEALTRAGFRDIVINVSHLGDRIVNGVGDGAQWNARIRYSREVEPLETAGGIATALPLLGSEPFVVVNSDIYTDFAFSRLRSALPDEPVLAHLVLIDNPPHHARGDFALDGDRLCNQGDSKLTFSGIGVYRPRLFAAVPAGTKRQLASVLRPQIDAGLVSAERFDGHWSDIGTPERLAELDRRLRL
jgi:MurNAc alpha-1-phosphate uridylyltransferase